MDPRNVPQDPFARAPSETSTREPRSAPIPPPPYTLQAPVRQSQPTFTNDPFLPCRNELDGSRQEPHRPVSQSPFSLEKYSAGLRREPSGPATVSAQGNLRDTNVSWSLGERILNGYRPHETKVAGSASSSTPLPPPPPPPTSSFASSILDGPALRDPDRQRDHRPSSPRMYGAARDHPPPPPPPFTGRPMLPPSPQYNPPASMSRVPPPPPPVSGGRDLPSLSSANRPGSSMSISSMLDSAPIGRPPREAGTATTLNGASPTGSYSSLAQQQPPPTPSPTHSSNGNGFLCRSSPEKHPASQASTNRPFRAYSGGATHRSYPSVKASSPEGSRFGPLSATSIPQYSSRSGNGGQPEWKLQHNKNSTMGRIIDRPSSQPNGYSTSPLDMDRRRAAMDAQALGKAKQEENALREASLRQANRDGVSSFDFLGRQAQLQRQRELENVEFERQKRLEQEQRSASQSSPQEERLSGMNYPFLTQSSVFSEPSITASRPEKESTVIDRLLERSYQPQRSTHKGLLPEESLRRLREERQKQTQQTTKYSSTASRLPFLGNVDERQVQTYPYNTTTAPSGQDVRVTNNGTSQQQRPADDGSQSHRTMLALINDNSKRAGRISPLPQAVQGAQGQKRGPSSDPSIKNEFSRMFAGIGSGVGSAGLNSGASTPFPPPSPKQNSEADQRIPFNGRNDPFEARARNGSRIGKRAKKVKDADTKDVEIIDDRTMAGSGGVKRQKHSHHHHLNHRHHHHHRQDEQNGMPSHRAGDSTTPVPRNHLHHHHRPDGTIHYHPSSSKPPTTHHKAPRIPSTTIKNDSTLNLVRDLPRRHLGSTLYSPSVEPPTSPAYYDTKLPYATAPYTIPRCEGKENCTLTVRIPRVYLSKDEREQVCARRAVWGTDIYTDDSDPLAAATHAGWIRGEWGDGVDVSMLEINPPSAGNEPDSKQMVFTAAPASPKLPIPGKDLHLTLLILPTLQKYASRVAHGVKSRAWGSDHDGLSFRIEKMAWVDEGAGRGEGRGAQARHKRLQMATGSRVAAPPLRLTLGKGVGKARDVLVAG